LPLQILNETQVPTTATLEFPSIYLYTLWLAPWNPICPVLSARIQNSAVLTHIGVSDSNQLSYDWHPRFQVSDNERPEYTALIAGFQIRIRQRARSFQMKSGFMKRS
jgi:hypothetical protein